MKNLKKLLGLVIISVVAFVTMGNVDAATDNPTNCGSGKNQECTVHAVIDNEEKRNESAYFEDIDAVQTEINQLLTDGVDIYSIKIKLLEDNSLTTAITTDVNPSGTGIDVPTTIELNGYELTLPSTGFKVLNKGALSIVGADDSKVTGTSISSGSMVEVERGGQFTSSYEVEYDVSSATFVSTTSVTGSGVATVTINSGASVKAKVGVSVDPLNSNVALDAEFETTDQSVLVASNTSKRNVSTVSINGGKYISTSKAAVKVDGYANITIKDGEFVSKDNTVNTVLVNAETNMTIEGGKFTHEGKNVTSGNGYALVLGGKGVVIKGGEFTSGSAGRNDQPAVYINTDKDDLKGSIYAGIFNYGLVALGGTTTGQAGTPDDDEETIKELIATTSSYTINKDNDTVVVKNGATTEDPSTGDNQQPSDEQKPNTGDNQPSENPKTFDAIGSLVTMAISSLGVVGTATKKVLK